MHHDFHALTPVTPWNRGKLVAAPADLRAELATADRKFKIAERACKCFYGCVTARTRTQAPVPLSLCDRASCATELQARHDAWHQVCVLRDRMLNLP